MTNPRHAVVVGTFTWRLLSRFLLAAQFVLIGLWIGAGFEGIRRSVPRVEPSDDPMFNYLTQWDGQWYLKIASHGYSYEVDRQSSVAFFPVFPLLGSVTARLSGSSPHASLWGVAHVCLVGSFIVFLKYMAARSRRCQTFDEKKDRLNGAAYATSMLALYPPCFFLWMAYSDSLFLLLCVVPMLGIRRGWRRVWIALIIGAATATRPVGVALLGPFALYLFRREGLRIPDLGFNNSNLARKFRLVGKSAVLMPLACWGLLAYMAYLWYEFDAPLAFAQTQTHWRMRPPVDWSTKALILASAEPIWSAYVPGSSGHWSRLESGVHPLLSLHFMEPIYFVGAVVLVYIGAVKRWLTDYEILLSAGLLLIPYVTKGYEMTMASQARFTTVVFPIYIVMGHILARMPRWAAVLVLAVFATYLCIYSAMWAAGHVLI